MIRFILLQLAYMITALNFLDNNNSIYLIMLLIAPIEFIGLGYLFKVIR